MNAPALSAKTAKKIATDDDLTPSQTASFEVLSRFVHGETDTNEYVLSGYAGTGKTWLLVKLLKVALDRKLHVAVCAPTHKAVSVIKRKIEDEGIAGKARCGTLHALLGLKLKAGRFGAYSIRYDRKPDKDYFEDYNLVFIDESSMVSELLLKEIRTALAKSGTLVLYFGDLGQLLPVEDREARPDSQDLLSNLHGILPPVFQSVEAQCRLAEIVRQKSTGRPHPVAAFAEVIRGYIEGETEGVLTPQRIRDYVESHRHELEGRVRLGQSRQVANMVVGLRKARPLHDIRGIAWRNSHVDRHNDYAHYQLGDLYEDPDGSEQSPFWIGETIIAREMLYAFEAGSHPERRDEKFWEDMLSPSDTPDGNTGRASGKGPKDKKRDIAIKPVQNNTEMTVERCDFLQHPYLHIPCWRIRARPTDEEPVEFFIADDGAEHRRLTRQAWEAYRSHSEPHKRAQVFRRAWTITRACAPVMHAYSMTAHKSQGSTFDCSIIDVRDLHASSYKTGPDDYHRALYVAVTRASEAVWLCV